MGWRGNGARDLLQGFDEVQIDLSRRKSAGDAVDLRCRNLLHLKYRVFLKKVLHEMQEKMKMTQQKDENLVQVQQ